MPIDGFSNRVRLDRLGRIRLGIRVQNPRVPNDPTQTIPKAVDYLVCPPEVQQVYGEKPTSIYPIMFPTNDPNEWLSQFYRCYGLTYGLTCFGDGITAKQKVDTDTGAMADRSTVEGHWVWKEELTCNPEKCEQFLKKRCRPIMRLQFMLPEVPGLGVYEVATTSYHSRMNIQSQIAMVRNMAETLTGKAQIALIPFTLAMGPQEVNPPGQKRKTVWILHLKHETKLGDFLRLVINPRGQFQLTEGVAQTAEEAEKEELPGDLMGSFGDEEEAPGEDEPGGKTGAASEQKKTTTAPKKTTRKPDDGKKQLTGASTTELPPGPAATALEEAAKKEAGQKVGAPLKEIDLFSLCKDLLGVDNWDLFVLPKMMQLFGHTEYSKMDLSQTILLKHSITAEGERRAIERKGGVAHPPGGSPPIHTSVEEELRKDITASLKTITQSREEALQWLQEHFQVKTLAGMSVDQLKKVKDAIAAKKTGDDVPF